MGVITAQDHKKKLAEQNKNIEAENKYVREHVWGASETLGSEDDEMGDNIYLGDIRMESERQQTTQAAPASSLAKTLGMAGLAAAGLGVGAAAPILAYNLTKPAVEQTFVEDPTVDTDTQYGWKIYRDEEQQ